MPRPEQPILLQICSRRRYSTQQPRITSVRCFLLFPKKEILEMSRAVLYNIFTISDIFSQQRGANKDHFFCWLLEGNGIKFQITHVEVLLPQCFSPVQRSFLYFILSKITLTGVNWFTPQTELLHTSKHEVKAIPSLSANFRSDNKEITIFALKIIYSHILFCMILDAVWHTEVSKGCYKRNDKTEGCISR